MKTEDISSSAVNISLKYPMFLSLKNRGTALVSCILIMVTVINMVINYGEG